VTFAPLGQGARAEVAARDAALSRVREAVELWGAEQREAALKRLEDVGLPELSGHLEVLRARILRDLGRADDAAIAARRALETPLAREVAATAWAEVAASELARGKLDAARLAYAQAAEMTLDAERAATWTLSLASRLEAEGAGAEAQPLYERIWLRWPRSAVSAEAFTRDTARRDAGEGPPLVSDDALRYARQLASSGSCDRTLAILERLSLEGDALASTAELRADCLFTRRRYDEARKAYQAIVRSEPANTHAAIQAARSVGRSGDAMRAVGELSELAQSGPPEVVPRAQYLVAQLLDTRDRKSAVRLLRRVAEQTENDELARDASWDLAWDALSRGRFAEARRWLAPLTGGDLATSIEVQRARYWSAVAELDASPKRARAALREIAREVPLSYYGLLAAERVGQRFQLPPEAPPADAAENTASPAPPPEVARARWLQIGGVHDLAFDEARSWVASTTLTREVRVAAAALLHELGQPFEATRLVVDAFGPELDTGANPAWLTLWRAAWPKPYANEVARATSEFGFDEHLVYAIMREESLYRPAIESNAGARGLMQLIPPTAEKIATSLALAQFSPDWLYEPETNVRFGTYYLNELARKFEGSRPLMIAAYNAGPDAVQGWRKRTSDTPTDRFVDSVPYGETRRYLRRVLRSYHMYRLLYPATASDDPQATAWTQPSAPAGR
jgi:soluble lytic murein transglycosylase